ncbi:helix-turn-helix domain-containing protein [Mesorhizobium sp. IMUNJ 23232]|uniref:helix-turn-helix domain-containing protein n=1 Tax=Mesorhizobium sp. IMUNJ 23232 TaxID=3376064 RepID=UPI003791D194
MTSEDFRTWRKHMGFSQTKAAETIGVSRGSVENYERGSRREDDRAVEIPKTVALACIAAFYGLDHLADEEMVWNGAKIRPKD